MFRILVAPVLGGIIGYITNDLAIKMLFRPRKAVYIGKFHIPFTPGLIPQQKSRIAKSIGQMVSSHLLSVETLKASILSQETMEKLREQIQTFWDSLCCDTRTVREALMVYFDGEELEGRTELVLQRAADAISERIVQANVGRIIVDAGWDAVFDKTGANLLLSAFLPDDRFKESVKGPLESKLNELVEEKAPDIIHKELEKLKTELLDMRICDICDKYKDREEEAIEYVLQLTCTLLDNNMEKLLNVVDIEHIVVEKINAFDAVELENMIFGIMKRELNAIVYLGAGLGFLMGFINLLF